jgi:hypothetical protein
MVDGFKKGTGRGQLNKGNHMKVHCDTEAFWVKIVAINKLSNEGIGIMEYSMINQHYLWGDFVLIRDSKIDTLAEVVGRADRIPCTKDWKIL